MRPRVLPKSVYPPSWFHFWLHFGSQIRGFFVLFFGFVFWSIFEGFWKHFGSNFGSLWEVILATFSDFAKKGAPHEFIVNSSEIEGRAPGKAIKKRSKIDEKTVWKHTWKKHAFFMNFGIILGGFGIYFRTQNAFKIRVKFWMRFWRPKKRFSWFSGIGPAECAGALGGIMEGY